MNTGVEAVETAIKIARRWGQIVKNIPQNEAKILFMSNNFHGRTISVCGGSDDSERTTNFGPFPTGFDITPFNDIEALET